MIQAGEVAVNGQVISTLPAWVDPEHDHITVRGKSIKTHKPMVYVMLFKPCGVVSTNDDPEGRRRAIDLVRHPTGTRLYPVGRLDIDSSGLLLLTNDGNFANRLSHPSFGVHKTYDVTLGQDLDDKSIRRLERGLFLGPTPERRGGRTAPSQIDIIKRDRNRTRLRIELQEGRNRQIRRMMAELGFKVRKLRRVQVGPLPLKGLRPGHWRDLTPKELSMLKRAAGMVKR
jgi:pseudouridine synthase